MERNSCKTRNLRLVLTEFYLVHPVFNVLPERKAAFGEGGARLIEDQTIRTVLLGNLTKHRKEIIKARFNKRDSLRGFILLLADI
jgi:hypothetical protein